MRVQTYASPQEFWDAHQAVLLGRETENVLMISLLQRLISGSYACNNPVFAAVYKNDVPVLLTLRTPPHYQILASCTDLASVPVLVDDLADQTPDLPGVLGPKEVVTESLNIRQAPLLQAPVIGTLKRGSSFKVTVVNGWAKLGDGQFVLAKYLSAKAPLADVKPTKRGRHLASR